MAIRGTSLEARLKEIDERFVSTVRLV